MICQFCQKPCIPIFAEKGDIDYRHGTWMCGFCPKPVKYVGKDHSIYCFYNKHWYKVAYTAFSKTYRVYLVDTYEMTDYGAEHEYEHNYYRVNVLLALEVPPGLQITPDNIEGKLPTLLVFS